MDTAEPDRIAPDDERETLAAVESLLGQRRRTLAFPDWLERRFEREMGARYGVKLSKEIARAAIFYNIFLVGDLLLAPDTIRLALALHLVLVTPAMGIAAWRLRRGLSPAWRDLAAAATPVLITLQILLVFLASRAPTAPHYLYFVLMTTICSNTALRLRYRAARAATWSAFFMLGATLLFTDKVAPPAAMMQCISLAVCGLVTLDRARDREREFRADYLQKLRDRLHVAISDVEARHDALTGVANRRGLDDLAAELWRNGDAAAPMSVILFDIDHFKNYNDVYGHQAGDACLKKVAASAAVVLRALGFTLARYGGEEFVALLPNRGERQAGEIAERLRIAIASLAIAHARLGDAGRLSASFGVASAKLGDISFEALMSAADSALYAAKRNGRNQVAAGPIERVAAA